MTPQLSTVRRRTADIAAEVVAVTGGGITSTTPAGNTIVDVLRADARFSTLVDLLTIAGLDSELASTGPFTLFAPTNDAWAAVPPATLEGLKADPAALAALLRYHVVGALVPRAAIASGNLITLAGTPVSILVDATGFHVNTSTVIAPDIAASNGLIHGIDKVLAPQ